MRQKYPRKTPRGQIVRWAILKVMLWNINSLFTVRCHAGNSQSPGSVQESLAKVFFVLCQSSCLSQFIDCYNLVHFGVTEAECSVLLLNSNKDIFATDVDDSVLMCYVFGFFLCFRDECSRACCGSNGAICGSKGLFHSGGESVLLECIYAFSGLSKGYTKSSDLLKTGSPVSRHAGGRARHTQPLFPTVCVCVCVCETGLLAQRLLYNRLDALFERFPPT